MVVGTRNKLRLERLNKHLHYFFSMPKDKNPQQNGEKKLSALAIDMDVDYKDNLMDRQGDLTIALG